MRKAAVPAARLVLLIPLFQSVAHAQDTSRVGDLDRKVQAFLERHQNDWHDMNVPAGDGKILHELILNHRYTRALEIGTSTGHSAIWIAWALSRTGGKLITVEIDEERYRAAIANFKEAGLASYVDARLADAHELVPLLQGPFDFVFCDADKEWYRNYFTSVAPKMEIGGCFAAHNVSLRGWGPRGTGEFITYVLALPNFETRVDKASRSGLSLSVKKSER
jgi:predicted O-methyltransferase YrrM